MPRRLLGICILLLVSVMCMQAQGDAVLLKVGSEVISKGEFEYYYKKSLKRDLHLFLQSFIDYKLKVLDAKERGLDTVGVYRVQKEFYRQLASSEQAVEHFPVNGREWVKLSHVTFPLKQHAGEKEEQRMRQKADSLYVSLQNGAEWKQMGEELPWMQTRFLLKEWQEQLLGLEQNQVSAPFYSPQGIHLIVWEAKRNTMPKEVAHERTRDTFWLKEEMANALLLAIRAREGQAELVPTERVLEDLFRKYREKYGWGIPHFRGVVVHCQNKKEAKAIKKYLRKFPVTLWQEALERMPAALSAGCTFETGLFRIGQNPYVDKLAFKCGSFAPITEYPYTWILGDKLKKGPESYRDVREKVEIDARNELETAQINGLRQKYRVEINEEVLKTVNNEGNK